MADKNLSNTNNQPGEGDDNQETTDKKPSSSSLQPLEISSEVEVPVTTTPTSVAPPSAPVTTTTPPPDPTVVPQPSSSRKRRKKKKQPSTPSGPGGSSQEPLEPIEARTCPICQDIFDSSHGMRGHTQNHSARERALHFGLQREEREAKKRYDEWESTNRAIKAATESFTLNIPGKVVVPSSNVITSEALAAAVMEGVGGGPDSIYAGISEAYGMGKRPLDFDMNEPLPPMSPSPPPEDVAEETNWKPRRGPLNFDVNETPPDDEDDDQADVEEGPPQPPQ